MERKTTNEVFKHQTLRLYYRYDLACFRAVFSRYESRYDADTTSIRFGIKLLKTFNMGADTKPIRRATCTIVSYHYLFLGNTADTILERELKMRLVYNFRSREAELTIEADEELPIDNDVIDLVRRIDPWVLVVTIDKNEKLIYSLYRNSDEHGDSRWRKNLFRSEEEPDLVPLEGERYVES